MIMTQEEKAKAYDEAIEKAKEWYFDAQIGIGFKANLEILFPELKRSEDERIRKEIIEMLRNWASVHYITKGQFSERMAWLEKQGEQKTIEEVNGEDYGIDGLWHAQRILKKTLGSVNGYQSDDGILDHKAAITAVKKLYEQKPVDKVEPKFPEGVWVVDDCDYVWEIKGILNQFYILEGVEGGESRPTIDLVDKTFHLWTIQDAKSGDVLFHSDSASNGIFIFKEILQRGTLQKVICYCDYDSEDGFCLGENHTCCWTDSKILHPATKEQRDLLFQKMKEAGYEWDTDKKELNKEEVK